MPKNVPYLIRFLEKVTLPADIVNECWIWHGAKTKGYGRFGIDGREYYAQVAAKILFQGQYPKVGQLGCHTCDNPPCVNPLHVFFGTVRENSIDARDKGRFEHIYLKKLNARIVAQIIEATGTQRDIAKRFNISQSVVSEVRSGKSLGYLRVPIKADYQIMESWVKE